MSILHDAYIASLSSLPFKRAFKRARHIRNGHPKYWSVRIDKLRSEKHPQSNDLVVFTINIMECEDCGLIYMDSGVEFRK
jgi:hypothetical protein